MDEQGQPIYKPILMEVIDPKDYYDKIIIGRDGLIVEKGMKRGLLLPQVPIDHGRNWRFQKL